MGASVPLRDQLARLRTAAAAAVEHEPDDPLRALLEALAEQLDIVAEAMERIAEEAYLATGGLPGVYVGCVLDSDDPLHRGRLKVDVPAVGGAPAWAPTCVPLGAAAQAAPSPGDRVWVTYEEGDAERPVVLGAAGG